MKYPECPVSMGEKENITTDIGEAVIQTCLIQEQKSGQLFEVRVQKIHYLNNAKFWEMHLFAFFSRRRL